MKIALCFDNMFAMTYSSIDDMIDQDFSLDFFNQTAFSNSTSYQNQTKDFIFDVDWIPIPVNKTNSTDHDFETKLKIPLFLIETTFRLLGIALQCLIIYFERFERDSQKRGSINRVSWILVL